MTTPPPEPGAGQDATGWPDGTHRSAPEHEHRASAMNTSMRSRYRLADKAVWRVGYGAMQDRGGRLRPTARPRPRRPPTPDPCCWCSLAERPTPTTRQVSSGGPPPQLLRDPGQPQIPFARETMRHQLRTSLDPRAYANFTSRFAITLLTACNSLIRNGPGLCTVPRRVRGEKTERQEDIPPKRPSSFRRYLGARRARQRAFCRGRLSARLLRHRAPRS
jgi:hypothetical protein